MVCSSSTLQRSKNDIKVLSPHSIPPKSHKRSQKSTNREHDLERPQMTSNVLKRPQMTSKQSSPVIETVKPNTSKKNKVIEACKIEINDKDVDKNLQNKNL